MKEGHLLTRDRIAKHLEIEAIARYVKDGMSVVDVGCGDGETARRVAGQRTVVIEAFDASMDMIELAYQRCKDKRMAIKAHSSVFFRACDVLGDEWPGVGNWADLVYTQRCLVCLLDWEAQKRAIANIARCLKPGGLYVMCECSWEGLQAINDLRERVGLYCIEPPAWDRYLRDAEVEAFAADNGCGLRLEAIDDYSGTYYFLSRVINAALASAEGCEPDYDSPINRLALSLPPLAGLRGQGRVWLWRKT